MSHWGTQRSTVPYLCCVSSLKSSRDWPTLVSIQSSTHCSHRSRRAFDTGGQPQTRSPCGHMTSRIAFPLKRRPELCLSTSQQPTTLYETAASPASCCDCCLIDAWSAWSLRWLAIAGSPLPQVTAKEAGYDASRTASHRDMSWCPYCSTSTSLTCQPQKVCICWRSSNHACWWRSAGSGRSADQGHGNRRWIPSDLEAKGQHYKNGVGSLPQQGSYTWVKSQILQRNRALLLRAQIPRSNIGQVAHVSPTSWVTSQEADIMRRASEAAFCSVGVPEQQLCE